MNRTDNELRHYLKNWADHQPLPEHGKAKLIAAAATLKTKTTVKSPVNFSGTSNDLISWAMVYSNDRRMSMARLIA